MLGLISTLILIKNKRRNKNPSFCPKSYHERNLLMFMFHKYSDILKSIIKTFQYNYDKIISRSNEIYNK